jgi:hypothetical protein
MHHLADIAEQHAGAVLLHAQVQPHMAAVERDAVGVQPSRRLLEFLSFPQL